MQVNWETLSAVGALATPLVVLVVGFLFSRRQSRSEELLRLRLDYYKSLMPKLNDLMCCMTFIGGWRDLPPPRVVELKRRLDREFNCAWPLFSEPVKPAYDGLMDSCFKTFNAWGEDPGIVSSAFRRRQAWRASSPWDPAWDRMFAYPDTRAIPGEELTAIRHSYDALVRAMVNDLDLARARSAYTSARVSLNASGAREDIAGRSETDREQTVDAAPFHEAEPS